MAKSVGVALVLLDLLSNLGKPGWPKVVTYRVEDLLFTWRRDSPNQPLPRSEVQVLESFKRINLQLDKSAVKIIELLESERDLRAKNPCFVTLSGRDAEDRLKTLDKTRNLIWKLMDPWSLDDGARPHLAALESRPSSRDPQ